MPKNLFNTSPMSTYTMSYPSEIPEQGTGFLNEPRGFIGKNNNLATKKLGPGLWISRRDTALSLKEVSNRMTRKPL